jgi:hypothetical protein
MLDFEDPWWLTAVVLLVVLWVMGAVIPVRMIAPQVSAGKHFLTEDESPEADAPPPIARPSLLLPILVCVVSLGLVTLSLMKRINEHEGGTRWMWMAAAAGLSAFWGLVLTMFSMRMR